MSAARMVLNFLVMLVAMAAGGLEAAIAIEQIKERAGAYWPRLEALLKGEGLSDALAMVPGADQYRPWFELLAAELSGTGKKTDGRTTRKPRPSTASKSAAPGAGKAGSDSKRPRRRKADT